MNSRNNFLYVVIIITFTANIHGTYMIRHFHGDGIKTKDGCEIGNSIRNIVHSERVCMEENLTYFQETCQLIDGLCQWKLREKEVVLKEIKMQVINYAAELIRLWAIYYLIATFILFILAHPLKLLSKYNEKHNKESFVKEKMALAKYEKMRTDLEKGLTLDTQHPCTFCADFFPVNEMLNGPVKEKNGEIFKVCEECLEEFWKNNAPSSDYYFKNDNISIWAFERCKICGHGLIRDGGCHKVKCVCGAINSITQTLVQTNRKEPWLIYCFLITLFIASYQIGIIISACLFHFLSAYLAIFVDFFLFIILVITLFL